DQSSRGAAFRAQRLAGRVPGVRLDRQKAPVLDNRFAAAARDAEWAESRNPLLGTLGHRTSSERSWRCRISSFGSLNKFNRGPRRVTRSFRDSAALTSSQWRVKGPVSRWNICRASCEVRLSNRKQPPNPNPRARCSCPKQAHRQSETVTPAESAGVAYR